MVFAPANTDASHSLRRVALAVHQRLENEYGRHQQEPRCDPLSELIATILSQNTSDVNSHRAFQRLRETFQSWNSVLDAPVEEIARSIQSGGLAQVKAPRIKAVLAQIMDRKGTLSLDFLRDMETSEARGWLRSLPGVGAKTAAIVLLFSLGKPAMPVDTHVHRVTRRLGLIGPRDSAERAHELLEKLLPPETYHDFHINILTHGRRVCTARNPRCPACAINDLCAAYQRFIREGVAIR